MARIYTKAGDAGRTGYLGKGRLAKNHPRIAALGSLDELNAALGMVLADPELSPSIASPLRRIQNTLFDAGASVASADPERGKLLLDAETGWLEERRCTGRERFHAGRNGISCKPWVGM